MGGPSASSRHQHHASPSLDALRSALPPPPAPSGAGAGGVGGVGVIGGKVKAKASTRVNIVDRSLAPLGITASGDVYALLFSELVQYSRNRVTSVTELEARLAVVGGRVGQRALTLLAVRDAGGPAGGGGGGGSGGLGGSGGVLGGKAAAGAGKREVRVLGVLNLVVSGVWKFLFGKQADGLKKVNDSEDEYYIEDVEPLVNKYVSVPKDYGSLNCAAFIAGVIHGVLLASGFPADVNTFSKGDVDSSAPPAPSTASTNGGGASGAGGGGGGVPPLTIYFIKFHPEVMARERRLGRLG